MVINRLSSIKEYIKGMFKCVYTVYNRVFAIYKERLPII